MAGSKALLLSVAAVLATALELAATRLPIQVFTTAQGLPRNSAACLVPDGNGLLWLCTSEGLVRFDGSEFRTFGREQGLPSSVVLDFLVSSRGGYWVLTDAGVCRLSPGSAIGDTCRMLPVDRLDGELQPDGLVESPDGRIWMATDKALYRSSSDGRKLERTAPPLPDDLIAGIGAAPDGQLLVSTDHAVYLWDGHAYRNLSGPRVNECGYGQIQVAAARDIWVVGCNLYHITGWDSVRNLKVEPVLTQHAMPARVLIRRDRSVWLAAPPGLQHWEMQPDGVLVEKEQFGTKDGLPYSWITRLAEDSQGNLWGATEGLGIFRILATGFRVYSSEEGLGSARIASIFEDNNGDLCVTTSAEVGSDPQSQFRVKNGERFDRVDFLRDPRFHGWGWGWNQVALQAHDGEWWFQTERGLYRFPKKPRPWDLNGLAPSFVYDRNTPLGEDEVFRIFEDSHGDVWISTDAPRFELVVWERSTGRFHHWTTAEGWPSNAGATEIRESASGAIWLGTPNSIVRFRHGRFDKVDMPYNRDVYIDRAQRVWVATARNGVYRCDNPEAAVPVFGHYGAHEGLSSDSTRSITEDDSGLIYVGTVRAVDRIDPRAPIGGANILHFTAADGLPDADQNVAYRDKRGHLWFGTLKGLAEYDPAQSSVRTTPEVYIRRVRVRGEDVPQPWEGAKNFSLHLQSSKNQVEIEYAGIDLRSVASLRYQYRLSGVDTGWSQPSPRFNVNYANLPPGKRMFEVRAVGADGVAGNGTASLALDLDAPLLRRPWFFAAAALLLCATAYWLYSYRVGHLLAMERLRTRIATDLHDDIGSSLTQISVLTEIGGRDASRNVLSEVAVISRDMVDEMSDIVWAASPRHDRFDSIVHRMRRFAEDAMADGELVFDASQMPPDLRLPLELRRPLYLVFKEAVNNVARHARATRMVVRIAARDASIELAIEDNGCGFDPGASPYGEGLASIRRRMKEISGAVAWHSAPGQGTRFQATLPLPSRGSVLGKLGGLFGWRTRLR